MPELSSSSASLAALQRGMLAHLEEHYAEAIALMAPVAPIVLVRRAIAGAQAHGVKETAEAFRYLDLVMVLGSGFYDDPQLPWVSQALEEKTTMRKLWARTLTYVREESGFDGQHYIRALLRAKRLSTDLLTSTVWTEASAAIGLLGQIHPEKLRLVKGGIEPMFSLAQRYAQQHEGDKPGVRPFYMVLMFLLGSHFQHDPRYTWALSILCSRKLPVAARYQKLHAEAFARLELALKPVDKSTLTAQED